MARKTTKRARAPRNLPERILETALAMAEESGWSGVNFHTIADELGVSMTEIRRHYRDLDAVADAWFALALDAMLAPTERYVADLPARERLYALMLRWFGALEPHRVVTGEMLAGKMHLPHPHRWVPMIFNLSRTIQLLRDAAGLEAGGRRRQVEEIGLTTLFLTTLWIWLRDDTPGQERTRRFLERSLLRADGAMARLFPSG